MIAFNEPPSRLNAAKPDEKVHGEKAETLKTFGPST
jgi:hypothetical protein